MLPEKKTEKYTYADYLRFPEGQEWEIIEGIPYAMSPAPTWQHQFVSGEIFNQFKNYLKGKKCMVFASPFDLRIPEADEDGATVSNVVQPDITIVCDRTKLSQTGYEGTPFLIVEVLSPSTAKIDLKIKMHLYEKAGVKFYLIADVERKYITVYELDTDNKYKIKETFFEGDKITIAAFEGFELDVSSVYDI